MLPLEFKAQSLAESIRFSFGKASKQLPSDFYKGCTLRGETQESTSLAVRNFLVFGRRRVAISEGTHFLW